MKKMHIPPARATTHATTTPLPIASSVHAGHPAAAPEVAPYQKSLASHAIEYQIDRWQRLILFLDTLRTHAGNMLEHESAGMPPLLDFEYETVLDARQFSPPANYALLRITRCGAVHASRCVDPQKAPVVIIDPRAGHGPGIGGFKRDSEVGVALGEGHATYFVVFYPQPCPQQTLGDVLAALRRFVEEVATRHPGKPPVLYGNCQAGWAVTLLAAGCEGLAGPTVLNGSPLSYWAGQSDVNPMRLAGGLIGGEWTAHMLADLGNGNFDGAWLVQNFENLNPANTLWEKNYRLFSRIDTERERFLEFERWWTGYYFLSREEILAIVENLFIGNKLERGILRLDDCCYVDLKRMRNPVLIFASAGDNITPPHQALNWIPAIYPRTEDLKAAGQRIVYLLNANIGHLGIFVSADVAKFEHRAILENIGRLDSLEPGLYEMTIDRPANEADGIHAPYNVRFEERRVEQIRYPYHGRPFENVQALSEWNDRMYRNTLGLFVRAYSTPSTAQVFKWMHPMRTRYLAFSPAINPWMVPVQIAAALVRSHRAPAENDNPFVHTEQAMSSLIGGALDCYRQWRDSAFEAMFSHLYGTSPLAGGNETPARDQEMAYAASASACEHPVLPSAHAIRPTCDPTSES